MNYYLDHRRIDVVGVRQTFQFDSAVVVGMDIPKQWKKTF